MFTEREIKMYGLKAKGEEKKIVFFSFPRYNALNLFLSCNNNNSNNTKKINLKEHRHREKPKLSRWT